ncbi:MAG: hypothetical protein ACT4QC_10650 [Planctomycetaceae bacterium]
MPDHTDYQKKIIKRYYDNRDQVDEQKLGELVTNLYLQSAAGKKTARLWEQARALMSRLGVPESRIEHIVKAADPAPLAEVLKDIQSGVIKKPAGPRSKP